MKKKILSTLLALVMLLALVPATVFAAVALPAEEQVAKLPFTVEKVWNDDLEEHDGVKVDIKNPDGDVVDTVELPVNGQWSITVDLPVIDGDYTVEEQAVEGYTAAYDYDYNRSLTLGAAAKIATCRTKNFEIGSDAGYIAIANTAGKNFSVWTEVELSDAQKAQIKNDLAKISEINQIVSGDADVEFLFGAEGVSKLGGIVSALGSKLSFKATREWAIFFYGQLIVTAAKATVTNTPVPVDPVVETVNVNVTKVWDDNNNAKRPETVSVQLLADGKACGDVVELSDKGDWFYVWNELAKCDDNGKEIVYTVQEVNIPEGYTAAYSKDDNGGLVITNMLTPVPTPDPVDPTPTPTPTPAPAPVKTGDTMNMGLYIVLAILAVAAVAVMVIVPMKKHGKREGKRT